SHAPYRVLHSFPTRRSSDLSRSVPMKTRKRFRAHQSIHREITLHPSFGVHRELFGAEHLPAATHDDADLPGSPGLEDTIPLVNAFALVIQGAAHAHGRHAHLGHGWHEERNGHFCTRDGRPVRVRQFHTECVVSFSRGSRFGSELNRSLRCVHHTGGTCSGRRGNK